MGLRPEPIKLLKHDIPLKLKERLTPEELNFLKSYRIELNAMTSGQLIGWIESNLQKLGLAKKLIPPADILANEISINLDEDRNVRAAQVVREKLKTIGINLDVLEQSILNDVPKPDTEGHMAEVEEFLKDLPTIHWRSKAENKAEELLDEQDEKMETSADTRIKELKEELKGL
jgi:hypothetical protein